MPQRPLISHAVGIELTGAVSAVDHRGGGGCLLLGLGAHGGACRARARRLTPRGEADARSGARWGKRARVLFGGRRRTACGTAIAGAAHALSSLRCVESGAGAEP